jgi:hypothetical protein
MIRELNSYVFEKKTRLYLVSAVAGTRRSARVFIAFRASKSHIPKRNFFSSICPNKDLCVLGSLAWNLRVNLLKDDR